MNKTSIATIAFALSSLAAGQAMAAKAPYLNETILPSVAAAAVTANKSRAELAAASAVPAAVEITTW